MSLNHEHPPLSINVGEKDKVLIFGGSCIQPSNEALSKANYFVALDKNGLIERHRDTPLHYFFPIEDGKIPDDIQEFNKMIEYLCLLISKKINIHIGCIGSHGRTGLVMSILIQRFCEPLLNRLNMSAIDYVRNLYCVNAVETIEQENFLIEHYKIKKPQMLEI